jgi:cell division septum initiation protein DivIVA
MATASEELASQAEQLKEIISYFRIDSNSINRQQHTVKQYASAKTTAADTQKAPAVKAAAYSAAKVINSPKTTGGKSSKGVSFKMGESGSDSGYEKF